MQGADALNVHALGVLLVHHVFMHFRPMEHT